MKNTNALSKLLFAGSLALLITVRTESVFSHGSAKQPVAIKLFDATHTFATGPVTSPVEAIPFASKSLILKFAPDDTAVISSTPDGKGSIVIDNFMTINGVSTCEGVEGQISHESCLGPVINPALPTGDPIEAVLTPIPPIDVSEFIPVGTTTVLFELRDFGVIAGNTDLFLVTTATVTPIEPPTAEHAFDRAMELLTGQLRPAVVEAFQGAFEQQVSTPVLTGLREANADPNTIAKVKQQLAQAGAEQASLAATTITSLLNGQTLLSKLERNLDKVFQQPATAPTSIEKFIPNVGAPKIEIDQSINDILAFGFNPNKLEFTWKDISSEAVFKQAAQPKPVFATVKPTGKITGKKGLDGKLEVSGEAGMELKTDKTTKTTTVGAELSGNEAKGMVTEEVPDLSRAGIVALLAAVIALGALRLKPAASGAP
jgi:hypothetical protein